MTKQNAAAGNSLGQADAVEVTPAMIEAGVYGLREKCFGESLREIVTDVYYAMEAERRSRGR